MQGFYDPSAAQLIFPTTYQSKSTFRPAGLKTELIIHDCELNVVKGQRGKDLLLHDGFTFSKNNQIQNKTYWACRTRVANGKNCRARITTIQNPSGFHTMIVTNSEHDHAKTIRMIKKIERGKGSDFIKTEDDLSWILKKNMLQYETIYKSTNFVRSLKIKKNIDLKWIIPLDLIQSFNS